MRQRALDLNGALRGFQGAAKFGKESVADGLDFRAVEAGKERPQQAPVFFEQFERDRLMRLRQRAAVHHVGEHDGGEPAVFGAGIHRFR
jgi:hypothetical protein